MSHLPQEIVSLIVSQLTSQHDLYNCTLINKGFHQVANPLLWHTPDIKDDHAAERFATFFEPSSAHHHHPEDLGQFVRSLSLDSPLWTDKRFLTVMQYLPALERLTMVCTSTTDISLQRLPHLCPHLASLELYHDRVNVLAMDEIGRYCRELRHLTLNHCYHLGPDTFSVWEHCSLRSLAIIHPCDRLMCSQVIKDLTIPGRFDALTELTLGTSAAYDDDYYFIGNLLFASSMDSCWPRMTKLTIKTMNTIMEDGMMGSDRRGHVFISSLVAFLRSHPNVTELHLMSGQYADSLLNAMVELRPPNITHMALMIARSFAHDEVRRLVLACPKLRSLRFSGGPTNATATAAVVTDTFMTRRRRTRIYPDLNHTTSYSVEHLDEDAILMIRQCG